MKYFSKTKLLLMIVINCSGLLYAQEASANAINWGFLIMGLFGGLSLFLYGMSKMSDGLKKAAGNQMRKILATLTKNRVIALFVGAFVTMIIQSSSATTVMLVSFVQAQLMTYVQSIGIILGANIGTTITAQLVAFKLTDYALLMIAVGFALTMFSKKEALKHVGEAVLGFGILFFGMKIMSDSMRPLRSFEPFIDMMRGLENPIYGLMIGAAFTALIQSSSAFTGIVIVLAQQGLLTLEAGIPMVLGANIGTCVTAGLASIGTIREAKRVAIAHVLFNLGGVLLFVWFIPPLAELVRSISSVSDLSGMEKLAAETPRQIANAHTIFNIAVGLIFLPFTGILAKQVYRLLPRTEEIKGIRPDLWHLDDSQVANPAIAIKLAQTEMLRMIKILSRMLDSCFQPFINDEPKQDEVYEHLSLIDGLDMREEKIDFLEEKITNYLFQVSRGELDASQAQETFSLISMVNDMESVGDIIHRNLVPLIYKKQALKESFSTEGEKELVAFHNKVAKQMSRLSEAFSELNFEMAQKVLKKDVEYLSLEAEYRQAHLVRVQMEKTNSVETHEVYMELMDMLKQINVYIGNIAKTITDIKVL
jgi:phosphate:Na+ symporter